MAGQRSEAASAHVAARAALERTAGETAAIATAVIREAEIEQARALAARAERAAGELAADGAGRGGKRIMGIAMGRFSGHYLTERLSSFVPLGPGAASEALIGPGEANLRAIEAVAGVTLSLAEHRRRDPAGGARRRGARGRPADPGAALARAAPRRRRRAGDPHGARDRDPAQRRAGRSRAAGVRRPGDPDRPRRDRRAGGAPQLPHQLHPEPVEARHRGRRSSAG